MRKLWLRGIPGSSRICQPMRETKQTRVQSPHQDVRKLPWRRAWQFTPVFLLGESHGQRSLVGCKSMESQRVWHGWMTNTFSSCASLGTIFLSLHAWPIINVPQEGVRAQGWRAVSSLRTKGGTEVGSSWCCKLPSSQSICGCYLVLCLAAWVYLRASFHCSCLSEQRGKPWLT